MGGVLLNHSRGGQSLAVLVLTCALGLQVWAFSLGAQPLFRWAQQAGGEAGVVLIAFEHGVEQSSPNVGAA